MIPSSASLDESERGRVRIATAFLRGRLCEPATIDWALRLKPGQQAERIAINDLLNCTAVPTIAEPYATAWRLIQESWSFPSTDIFPPSAACEIRRRIRSGDRSGALVQDIADLVAPRLEVKPVRGRPSLPARKRRRPKSFRDLLSASLTSISLAFGFGRHGIEIGLGEVSDVPFLNALASALMSAVDRGLYIVRGRVPGSGVADGWWPRSPARPV